MSALVSTGSQAALSASRLIDLERRRLPGRYDLAHLQAFHRYTLGDVYDCAGQGLCPRQG
jgi:cell filamentation protein